MNEQLVTMLQAFDNTKTAELEVIISKKQLQGKQSGTVPYEIFLKLWDIFKKSEELQKHKIIKYTDYFYPNNVRVRAQYGHNPQSIIKTKIASIHAKCPQRKFLDFHITLKNEMPTCLPDKPDTFFLVRAQEVRMFTYKNTFCYLLKKVATAATRELAGEQEPTFEIEIEILRDSDYFKQSSYDELAESFVAKILDLAGRGDDGKDELTMELSILPKSLKIVEAKLLGPKRKYVSKKNKKTIKMLRDT